MNKLSSQVKRSRVRCFDALKWIINESGQGTGGGEEGANAIKYV